MNEKKTYSYTFKAFRLEIAERQLVRDGVPIPLTTKAFDVIAFLVERAGHLVLKEELIEAIWPDSFVDEASVARIVHTLRKVLGEDQNGNKFIETVAKKGYRFVADVEAVNAGSISDLGDEGNTAEEINESWPDDLVSERDPDPVTDPAITPIAKSKASTWVLVACIAALIVASIASYFAFGGKKRKTIVAGQSVSIAVLPLKSINGENQDLSYRLGIADSLISRLVTARGLTVRSLSATWSYLDLEKDVAAIGKEQKVDFVLSSSYQIVDGKIRVTSQLINGETGNVDDTFKSDQALGGSFETQDAVASDVGGKILKRLGMLAGRPEQTRGTTNDEAYRLYLQGSYLVDKRKGPQTKKAIDLFDRAIEIDSGYARAYAGRAYAFRTTAWQSPTATGISREDGYLKAKADIDTALRLDPKSSEAYVVLGEMKDNYEWKFDEAESAHLKSIEIDPASAFARRYYALHLMGHGRFDEALEQIQAAIDIDPGSVFGQRILAQVLYYARRYDDSVSQFNRVIEMDPSFTTGLGYVWKARLMNGDADAAYKEFRSFLKRQKASDEAVAKFDSAFAAGQFTEVFRLGSQLRDSGSEDERNLINADPIEVAAQLGETDKAVELLEKELGARGALAITRPFDPLLDPIRSDPRYNELIKKAGLK